LARPVLLRGGMRKLILFSFVATAACAARPAAPTLPVEYECATTALVLRGNQLDVHARSASVGGAAAPSGLVLGAHDDAGAHFQAGAVEYVVPDDPRQDAVARVFADHQLVHSDVCTAHGGYSDALARYVQGESLDQVAHDLALDGRDAARDLVHQAMVSLTRRYYRDR